MTTSTTSIIDALMALMEPNSTSAKLPSMVMKCKDISNDTDLEITVAPESDITAFEMMKITQMLFVYQINPKSFNAFEYIKANNLERHFKYE